MYKYPKQKLLVGIFINMITYYNRTLFYTIILYIILYIVWLIICNDLKYFNFIIKCDLNMCICILVPTHFYLYIFTVYCYTYLLDIITIFTQSNLTYTRCTFYTCPTYIRRKVWNDFALTLYKKINFTTTTRLFNIHNISNWVVPMFTYSLTSWYNFKRSLPDWNI